MAIIIEAPKEVYSLENTKNFNLFLAGSITNCEDWQKVVVERLKDVSGLTIYNPRRENFPIHDPNAAEEQIVWEYNHLRDADGICMWFDNGSLGPIVLYELGRWVNSGDRPVVIGVDPEYKRKQDVLIQTKLSRPNLVIVDNLDLFVEHIKIMLKNPRAFAQ